MAPSLDLEGETVMRVTARTILLSALCASALQGSAGCDEPAGAHDDDGDGYATNRGDCDDGDPGVHPGVHEYCNGFDDDCDGETDEGEALDAEVYYADRDGDGHGNPRLARSACSVPEGYVDETGDCDDDDATAHEGGEEVCDGADNDCDGELDEGCVVEHCGAIASSETWEARLVHRVTCDVYVEGASAPELAIEAGTQVTFDADSGLHVGSGAAGSLRAVGTEARPIRFTSSAALPAPGDWPGIVLGPSCDAPSVVLERVIIEYGGSDPTGADLAFVGCDGAIDGSVVRHSAGWGVLCSDGALPTIGEVTFEDNASGDISCP
jgi:hypothetical protein